MTTDVLPLDPPVEAPASDMALGPDKADHRARVGRIRRLVRGRPEDPSWVRPALLALLGATAVLYLWGLGASGWANSFYSAAVQAGAKSWKGFFFGSSDAANFITVDKPPAALWVMELSARIFGVNSWSILVPQALEGVASVAVLYAAVRRSFRPGAALLAGLVLATTPVAALMFRYNNPDALLVLLLTVAAYATVRALERAGTWWLVLAMAAVGTGFITKMLQAFLVVPAIVVVYLIAAPAPLRRRIAQLGAGAVALVLSSGWWVAAVQLTPAADRPYIGGSQDNSLFNLIFGYNGLGRISGNESGSVGGAGALGSRWGPTGLFRFFGDEFGTQISWLIPAAVIVAVGSLWLWRRRPRTDRARAAVLLWGGGLVVTVLVISLAQGIVHPYYSVAAAPAIGALVGIGTSTLWQRRAHLGARTCLAWRWRPRRCGGTSFLTAPRSGCRGCGSPSWRWASPPPCSSCSRLVYAGGPPSPWARWRSVSRWPAPPPTPSTRPPPRTRGRSRRRARPRPKGPAACRARRVARWRASRAAVRVDAVPPQAERRERPGARPCPRGSARPTVLPRVPAAPPAPPTGRSRQAASVEVPELAPVQAPARREPARGARAGSCRSARRGASS